MWLLSGYPKVAKIGCRATWEIMIRIQGCQHGRWRRWRRRSQGRSQGTRSHGIGADSVRHPAPRWRRARCKGHAAISHNPHNVRRNVKRKACGSFSVLARQFFYIFTDTKARSVSSFSFNTLKEYKLAKQRIISSVAGNTLGKSPSCRRWGWGRGTPHAFTPDTNRRRSEWHDVMHHAQQIEPWEDPIGHIQFKSRLLDTLFTFGACWFWAKLESASHWGCRWSRRKGHAVSSVVPVSESAFLVGFGRRWCPWRRPSFLLSHPQHSEFLHGLLLLGCFFEQFEMSTWLLVLQMFTDSI